MKKYFNVKTVYGVETVDEIDSKDFDTIRDYKKECVRLLNEYRLSKMDVYLSSRCTNEWKNR